jgi:capsular exopolysaccharide synthesis family protein
MVLSAKAEQGSTTTISNLGITLAQAGKRVVIVDANTRTPELHRVFDLPNTFGFMDLLQKSDQGSLARALQPTPVPNLYAISSGSAPDNPWELFRSDNLDAVSQKLRGFADFVLYDTPSAAIFTDALNLAPVADAAVLCVRALQPLSGGEQRIIDLLGEAQVPVLGCVLNDVPAAVFESYPHYKRYYAALPDVPADAETAHVQVATDQSAEPSLMALPRDDNSDRS